MNPEKSYYFVAVFLFAGILLRFSVSVFDVPNSCGPTAVWSVQCGSSSFAGSFENQFYSLCTGYSE